MTGIPAITLHQPWASLVALGVKQIETRSWPAPKSLIGQRLLIHASATCDHAAAFRLDSTLHQGGTCFKDLPLGAILCSVRVADCLPIVDLAGSRRIMDADELHSHLWVYGQSSLKRWSDSAWDDFSDQPPYGDFRPGRFAWLLDDARRVEDECPWCGGTGNELLAMYRACPACASEGRERVMVGKCSGPIPAKGRPRIWRWTP